MAKMTLDKLAEMVARGFTEERKHSDQQFAVIRADIKILKEGQQELKGGQQEHREDIKELKDGQERIERKLNIQQTLLERHDTRITRLEKKVL